MLVGGYGRDLATSGGLADILGNLALYGVPLDEIGRYTGQGRGGDAGRGAGLRRPSPRPGPASVIVAGDAKAFAEAAEGQAARTWRSSRADELDLDEPDAAEGK